MLRATERRVNADFPAWLIESPGRQARRLGVNRQPVIKAWIAERPERGASPARGLSYSASSSLECLTRR
jgi:hypothetical protein